MKVIRCRVGASSSKFAGPAFYGLVHCAVMDHERAAQLLTCSDQSTAPKVPKTLATAA